MSLPGSPVNNRTFSLPGSPTKLPCSLTSKVSYHIGIPMNPKNQAMLKETDCPVCLAPIIESLAAQQIYYATTECNHLYHVPCIVTTLNTKLECAVCRHFLSDKSLEEQALLYAELGDFERVSSLIDQKDIPDDIANQLARLSADFGDFAGLVDALNSDQLTDETLYYIMATAAKEQSADDFTEALSFFDNKPRAMQGFVQEGYHNFIAELINEAFESPEETQIIGEGLSFNALNDFALALTHYGQWEDFESLLPLHLSLVTLSTAFKRAASAGQWDLVEKLYAQSFPVLSINAIEQVLKDAVQENKVEIAAELLQRALELLKRSEADSTQKVWPILCSLNLACELGHTDIVTEFVKRAAMIENVSVRVKLLEVASAYLGSFEE